MSVLYDAAKYISTTESRAEDVMWDEENRSAKFSLQPCINQMSKLMEVSGEQAVASIYGLDDSEYEEDIYHGDDERTKKYGTSTIYTNAKGKHIPIPQHIHYAYRCRDWPSSISMIG